jgi:S1-C subfamily serine protease
MTRFAPRSYLHRLQTLPCLLLFLSLLTPSLQAATLPPAPAQSMIEALSRASAAVVGVQVDAAEGARSAQTLGPKRSGSGVVIGPDGLVLTIGYLLIEAQNVSVTTADGKRFPARVVAYDLASGFGLVRSLLPLGGIAPVPLGNLKDVSLGQAMMVATGSQGKEDETDVASTQLVGKRAFSGFWEYHIDLAAFTSPPIQNHSGAPLFNQRGELVGVGSLLVMNALGDNRRVPGNMFVPVDLLRPILDELLRQGMSSKSQRPWLGLSSAENGGRVQVIRVNPGSPAEQAGIKPGDLVLAVDGNRVDSLEGFYKKLWDRPGTAVDVELTVLQGADVRKLILKAVDRMSTMVKPAGI